MYVSSDRYDHLVDNDPSHKGFDVGMARDLPETIIELGPGIDLMQGRPGEKITLFERVHATVGMVVTDQIQIEVHTATPEDVDHAHLLHSYNIACEGLRRVPSQSLRVVDNDGQSGIVFRAEVDGRYVLFVKRVGQPTAMQLRGLNLYEALGRLDFNGDELALRVRAGRRHEETLQALCKPEPTTGLLRHVPRVEEPGRKAMRRSRNHHSERPVRLPVA